MTQQPSQYVVRFAETKPQTTPDWNEAAWRGAQTINVNQFRPESSAHRPRTMARLLYDANGIHGIFRVDDQFVRCTRTNYQDAVWNDSCVEFFVQPRADKGYFNFEMNCGGAFLTFHIIDPTRVPTPEGLKSFTKIPAEIGQTIEVHSTLPKIVEPEITHPVTWDLKFFIPFSLFEHFIGPLGNISGQSWRGNFFKCAEQISHPHWASWSPVDEFNFHLPRCFGCLDFE